MILGRVKIEKKKDRETVLFDNGRYVNEDLNEIVNAEKSNETIELFLEE